MTYDREYFLTHHVGSRVRLEVTPDPDNDAPLEQIARAFHLTTTIIGDVTDVGPDALMVDPHPVYVIARDNRGGTPFMGKVDAHLRIAYGRILNASDA